MTHSAFCIRSDGDWLCAPGCRHDVDEDHARLVDALRDLHVIIDAAKRLEHAVRDAEAHDFDAGSVVRVIAAGRLLREVLDKSQARR